MTPITTCAWRRELPPSSANRLCEDPGTWLPRPVLFTGVREFTTTLELGRICLTTDATVSGPWRRGRTVSRRLRLDLRRCVAGRLVTRIEGDLVVAPHRLGGVTITFDGEATGGHGLLGRVGPALVAPALVREVVDRVASHLDQAPATTAMAA